MTAEPQTCPYCNAQAPSGVSGKVTCPRCGEVFTLNRSADAVAASFTESPRETTIPNRAAEPPAKPIRANRLVAGVVLAVMVLMAAGGLTYALRTVSVRRAHDASLPRRSRKPFEIFRKTEPESPEVTAPLNLAGVGYLPEGTNVVAGVYVQELLRSPAAAKVRGQAFKLGGMELKLDVVKDRLGLAVEEIDHLILGARLRDLEEIEVTPQTHLIVRTRQRYDASKVLAALGAKRPQEITVEGGKRSLYAVKVQNFPMQLWLPNEQTLVLGLFSKMTDLPAKPFEGGVQLPAEVREAIQQRVGPTAPIWLAGNSANWEKTVLPSLLALGGAKEIPVLDRIKQVRTMAIWIQAEQPPKLFAAFRCADEASAQQIEQQELTVREKKNPETFKFSREKEWLSVQIKTMSPAE